MGGSGYDPEVIKTSLPAPPRAVRATRIILAICAMWAVLLLTGAALLVLGARSIGWSPGATIVHVVGHAMEPTVSNGDYVLVDHGSTWSPGPGDIVVMRDPYDPSLLFIKRVVAGPGQTIQVRNAQVVVDGKPLSEPYVSAAEPSTGGANGPAVVGPVRLGSDEYFVLGDNRNHSADSRTFGPVHRDAIQGRATRILLPTRRARRL
jgi:signal peptidase I